MRLVECYDKAQAEGLIQNDCFQRQMLVHFQRVIDELNQMKFSWFKRSSMSLMGIYLYGPVGVGKTYLMDLFYECVDTSKKTRFHFHHFMQQIDAQLRRLQGHKNPLQRIAQEFSKRTRLLCLDEFFVEDIADAMILAELLRAMFEQGVVLVTTSNTPPDNLYYNGLQRARFLPAIDLLKKHCQVLSLQDTHDYRLGRGTLAESYLYPLNDRTRFILEQQFTAISSDSIEDGALTIQRRLIPFIKCSEHAVWFSFDVICNIPRSQLDYLEIATRFHTVFVSDMPRLTPDDNVRAMLLMHLIDVMYDNGVRIVLSSEVSVEHLYVEGPKYNEFQRTISRLHEMQSKDYLLRHPRRTISVS